MGHVLQTLLTRFYRDARAVALIEFALVFPIVMLMLLGGLEVGRAMVITQRTEKAAYVVADITSQYPPATKNRDSGEISVTELQNNVLPQFSRLMGGFSDDASQMVILTSVVKETDGIHIKWQIAGGGTLTTGVTSVVDGLSPAAIGPAVKDRMASFTGEAASLVSGMADDENMIVAEIFYKYQPVWAQVIAATSTSITNHASIATPSLLVKRMYFRPRNGDLICLPESFVYSDCS